MNASYRNIQYSELLHQMLPFRSKMHQNRWRLGHSAPPERLAVMDWARDLVTTLLGVNYVPLARDRYPLAVSRLATGLDSTSSRVENKL